jgi:hypothetical protein
MIEWKVQVQGSHLQLMLEASLETFFLESKVFFHGDELLLCFHYLPLEVIYRRFRFLPFFFPLLRFLAQLLVFLSEVDDFTVLLCIPVFHSLQCSFGIVHLLGSFKRSIPTDVSRRGSGDQRAVVNKIIHRLFMKISSGLFHKCRLVATAPSEHLFYFIRKHLMHFILIKKTCETITKAS